MDSKQDDEKHSSAKNDCSSSNEEESSSDEEKNISDFNTRDLFNDGYFTDESDELSQNLDPDHTYLTEEEIESGFNFIDVQISDQKVPIKKLRKDNLVRDLSKLSLEGRSYFNRYIMTINVRNAPSKQKNVTRAKQPEIRNHVVSLVANKDKTPDVVLTQEGNATDHKAIKKGFSRFDSIDKYDGEYIKDQVGIITKSSIFSERIAVPMNLVGFDNFNAEKNRLILFRLKPSHAENYVVGSWHGPYRNYTEEKRQEILKEMCVWINTTHGSVPWIIGGDFNLPYDKAVKVITSLKNKVAIKHDTSGKEDIIYFIHTPSIKFSEALTIHEGTVGSTMYLDHHPVSGSIKLQTE